MRLLRMPGMLVPRTRRRWRCFARWACVALFTVAHLFATIGVPLPSGFSKDHSIPFPCQDNPCGCRTAEECWLHCQCHTLEQRLAWAKARGVQPPEFLQKRLARGWDTRKHRGPTVAQAGCALCDASQKQPTACECCSCSGKKDSCCGESQQSGLTWKWHAALAELHCKGLSLWWAWTGTSLPPPTPLTLARDHPFRGFADALDLIPCGRSNRPAVPPPR